MKNLHSMGIHARELENSRIDGTRTYIAAILAQWLLIDPTIVQNTTLYHGRDDFNPSLAISPLYRELRLRDFPLWTQSAFAWRLYRESPDVLWMPLHNMPVAHHPRTRIVATIHDLAFKKFPAHFPAKDLRLHNLQTDYVVRHADHLIAVSHSTKSDIISYYPFVDPERISVIHHGIDARDWDDEDQSAASEVLRDFAIEKPYFLYIGALQPRKNLVRLIEAFDIVRSRGHVCSLVLAGEDAWLSDDIHLAASHSAYSDDIIMTGGISHKYKKALLQNAVLMAYSSLYEGFGLQLLEAFAARTPVVSAGNSSLREIAKDSAQYCDALDVDSIARSLEEVFADHSLQKKLVDRGAERVRAFSWEKSARKTLAVLRG